MKLEEKDLIVARPYKKVYLSGDSVVKVFEESHPKKYVFNEALNQAIVEETGLNTAKVQEVSQIDGKWALVLERKRGKTMEEVMDEDPANLEKYMDQFVSLQLEMHSKQAPMLNKLKDKLNRQISSLTAISATTRYELHTRLDSMPKHVKVCHGDFIPSNVIVGEDGSLTIIDWAHATQGNARPTRP